MCELLGISSNRESNIQFSSQAMQAHSQRHSHGWGVAFYPEESRHCRVFKEPKAMKDSDLFRYIQKEKTISSRIILNHIRLAAGGSQLFENTHPFVRELFGRDWALMHNGADGMDKYYREYIERGEKQSFIPMGTTGSEKALCVILNEINNQVSAETRLVEKGGNLRVRGDYDFEKVQRVIYETCQSIKDSRAHLNIILTNGEYLIAFHSGYNTLHYVLRDGAQLDPVITINTRTKRYFERLGQETSSLQKPSDQKAVIVATECLTDGEQWRKFTEGEFLVFKDGELAFRNGDRVNASRCLESVEVYDTSAKLDSRGPDAIGVSKRIRDELGIRVGDKVRVCKHGSNESTILYVHQTDRRLLKGGTSAADNPDYHVCIPREARNNLGLSRMNSAHRRGLDSFFRKYEPIDVFKV